MNRLLVVGSGGRLGAALARHYAQQWNVIGLTRAQLELGKEDEIRRTLEPIECELLINCAALTNVDYCETHVEEATQVNARAPGVIAEIARAKKIRMIHISTDYVFDGEKHEPYTEEDDARPLSVYGETKLLGEQVVLSTSGKNLVVRVSWVFGPDRPSFVDMILKRATEQRHVEAIADKISTPTYSIDAAEYLQLLLRQDIGGVVHLCNGGECSWRDYGQFALDCAAKEGVPLKARQVAELKLADMKSFVAQRPVYTVLSTKKFARIAGTEPRDWREAVSDYVRSMWG